MTVNAVTDFIGSVLLENATGAQYPGVKRPRVSAPNPYDDERMDISDRFRPEQQYDFPVSASASRSTRDDDPSGPEPYTGPLDVIAMTQSVEDQFVGAPRGLRGAMAPLGFSTVMTLGGAMSLKNLQRIETKIAEGEAGYGLAMLNNRIIGVSPAPIGSGYVLSGVLPENLTHNQRSQLIGNILSTREMKDNPKDFAVAPQPTIEPTDEERAASGRANIVYDGAGNPVRQSSPFDREDGKIVTTGAGRYTGQAELERQAAAKQAADTQARASAAAEEAARSRMAAQQNDSDDNNQPRNEYSIGTSGSSNPTERDGYRMNAKGGRVGMADGGSADPVQKTGFVEGSPDNYTKAQTVADDENRRVRVGSFVLNAPTTEKLQKAGVLPKGVDNSDKKTTIKANKGGMMDVALSKGEYVLEPEEAKEIGYNTLNKINDQGKPEVDRRQAMGHGGMTGTTEEIEAALTGTPTPAPTNFQNIILQDDPVELEYRHGESEFDGSYPSLDERDIEDELSPEAQAVLRNNPGLQTQLFTDMGPRIAQDNRNFMTTAQSMTAYDHMRQFERRGLGKLFPGATADEIMALTANPDITISDSKKSIASGEYQGADDAVTIYPHTIDLVNRLKYGYKGSAIGTKASGIDLFNVNDPIEKIYGSTVDSVTYHELLHMSYAKKMRRNLPFKHTVILEEYTNMGFLGGDERNWTPSDVLKERADIEAQLSKSSGPRKGKNREALLQRQEELNELIKGYKPDQNHSAMMYYEIERIMDETNDFPIDKRVVARQYIASKSMQYIPDSKQSEIMRMRMQILRRPENKKLLAALRKEDDFVMESKYFFVQPEFYAKFAVQNPELLPALDRFTNEFLTTTRRIHAHYSDEFRAALNANDVYDLPIGSTIRKSAINNLQEVNSVKRYPDYWGNKDRMYKIPPQMDLIQPRTYDPTKRDMVVPNEALQQFIFKSNSFMDSSATR